MAATGFTQAADRRGSIDQQVRGLSVSRSQLIGTYPTEAQAKGAEDSIRGIDRQIVTLDEQRMAAAKQFNKANIAVRIMTTTETVSLVGRRQVQVELLQAA